jgi:hypothetical protein
MRKLQHTWRWPLSLAAGLVLLLVLAEGAARFYPAGVLAPQAPHGTRILHLLPVPEIEVPATPRPDAPPRREPPEPTPTLVRDLWRSLIAERADGFLVVPDSLPAPRFEFSLRYDALLAAGDTSGAHLVEASRLLREGVYADYRRWGAFLDHLHRAQSYQARKSSIFNEDWLSQDALR